MAITLNPFDTSGFLPRWECGHWEPWLARLTIVSDALIFLAYAAIPAALAVVLIRRRDFPFPLILALFVAFILSCGLTHLVEVVIFIHPLYRLNAYMKAITAGVSLATAALLIRSLPTIFTLPSIQRTNTELAEALVRERSLSAELGKIRNEQEHRSAQLTSRMRRLTEALSATEVVACRWDPRSGRIEWEIGFGASAYSAGLGHDRTFENWSAILTPESYAELSRQSLEACENNTRIEFFGKVAGVPNLWLRMGGHPDPHVADQPAMVTGMFRFLNEQQADAR